MTEVIGIGCFRMRNGDQTSHDTFLFVFTNKQEIDHSPSGGAKIRKSKTNPPTAMKPESFSKEIRGGS